MLPEIKYQNKVYEITAANQQIIIDVATSNLYNTCTGINVLLSVNTAIFSTIQLDLDTVEVFPEKWEVIRTLFRPDVPFGEEYAPLNRRAAGSLLKGVYIDSGVSVYPYYVSISLRLENKEFTDAGKID